MQRLFEASTTVKLPFEALGVMFHCCELEPLQLLRTSPLLPLPSTHCAELATGEMVQPEPLAAMVKTELWRPADWFHCWSGEVPVSRTIGLPAVPIAENVYS